MTQKPVTSIRGIVLRKTVTTEMELELIRFLHFSSVLGWAGRLTLRRVLARDL